MAENAENQGGRMVVCSKHGLMYDASKRGGCERCIREWERQRSGGQAGFPTSVKVLGLVLVVAGLYVFFTRSPTEEPAPANAAPATPQPVAGAGREVAAEASEIALQQIVADVPEVIELGRRETGRLLADDEDPERQRQDWEFWALEWGARLQPLTDELPPPPGSGGHPALALAYQDVDRILNELRAVPQARSEGVPDPVLVEQRFEAAERALQQARANLARLGG
ncbi:MAG TPA: hypothetical protein VGG06_20340 [Thermoanaerobaculia bacterium]|jgi:hypothetical protein